MIWPRHCTSRELQNTQLWEKEVGMCRRSKEAATYAIVLVVLLCLLLPLHALLASRDKRDDGGGDQGDDCMFLWYMLHFQNAKSAQLVVQASWSFVLAALMACIALSVILSPSWSLFSTSHEPPARYTVTVDAQWRNNVTRKEGTPQICAFLNTA